MGRGLSILAVWLALLAMTSAGAAADVASWADERLPVRDGLLLWLDAGRQPQACQAEGVPPPAPMGPLATLLDGSGRGLRLGQRAKEARPVWVQRDDHAAVRFDGQDDRLERADLGLNAERLTIFIVAAPRSNPGFFAGLLAANATGQNDYTSAFTIDLGPSPSPAFDTLNVEGKGFGGARDLMDAAHPLGTFHVIEARVGDGPSGVAVTIDGQPQGRRERQPGSMTINEITLGARCYNNEGGPSYIQSFFAGDIAEVLVFDRLLDQGATRAVREYLAAKHGGITEALAPSDTGKPLKPVASPPAVQVLVPGFIARELPVKLTNINNIRYRPDGTLLAVAYNGNIYRLSDRDGDGLEEHVETFWESRGQIRSPIGMALTPPGYPKGDGLFVASFGKLSLIVDEDRDGRADREIIVADGWPTLAVSVDALGVAVGDDGSIYFGRGVADFTNAYQIDREGKAHYDPKDERGTIQRIWPDFSKREIIATGIRFPVALAFNRAGDLFATDQEGATWLPNGNPFDELLHIERGRHYGFPPRHSKHLPGVIDEPSVFDFRPQHQSTCGMVFNEPVRPKGPTFGPAWWAGDAIICGESRGKLWRTRLVKTAAGYVADTTLIAILNKLTLDACVAPDGSLAVATHSGPPDWGTGPDGPGTLYKITYINPDAPQPVRAWANGPREARIAFDRPLDPAALGELSQGISITRGKAVSAGDPFESFRPGYAVVAAQLGEPRFDVPVRGVVVTPDRRTIVLATDPQAEPMPYAVTLPGLGRPARDQTAPGHLPQEPQIDLAYDLGGVEAAWRDSDGVTRWEGWLPHFDLEVSRAFTAGSEEHEALWPLLRREGVLTMRARFHLKDMLRPAVQPGSRVDDVLPEEVVTLAFQGSAPLRATLAGHPGGDRREAAGDRLEFVIPAGTQATIDLALPTGARPPKLALSWHTNEDDRPRAMPLHRIRLPWTRDGSAEPSPAPTLAPELAGGNWSRGREVFLSDQALCSRCHAVKGQGGRIGPDLSNLVHRDYASVLRDITEPSATINPDHLTYSVALNDGRVLTGTLRVEGDSLRIGDIQGNETVVRREDVETMQPSSVSTMPDNLPKVLGPDRLRDLLTFLLTPDLSPAPIGRGGMPPPRTRAEVEAVLGPPPTGEAKPLRPIRIVLVAGPKDHGLDEHDYPLWQQRWAALLGRADSVTVETAESWPSADQLAAADVLVWYSANPGWKAERGADLDGFLERGGGMVYLHYAVNGRDAPAELARRIGLASGPGLKFRHGPLDLAFPSDKPHPITAGFSGLHLEDESYWDLAGDLADVQVLAVAVEDGRPRPQIWSKTAGKGRVVGIIPGHYTWTFDDPLFRVLLLRSLAWSANEPIDRFRDLIFLGARVAE